MSPSPPLLFRGQEHRAVKAYFQGTHRCVPPEVTLEKIRPCYRRAGLTRLADITGLDRIGITTMVAIRPNAASLVCSAGKGFTPAAAEASGAMEAIEVYHAESAQLPFIEASYQQLSESHRVVPAERLPLLQHSLFDIGRPEQWALGWDLIEQVEVAVPYRLIPLHGCLIDLWAHRSFDAGGSNGLASGNCFLEALCAGLYEVIERDALACSNLWRRQRGIASHRIDLDSIPSPLVQELLGRIRQVGVSVYLFDRTVDTEVPVYEALVADPTGSFGVFKGYGAHLDTETAMLRAITEALQSRLLVIAGARDDIFRYRREEAQTSDSRATMQVLDSVPTFPARVSPFNQVNPTFEADVAVLLDKISKVGYRQVVVFDLTQSGFEISVVKVIVPGFEGYMTNHYTPGLRARSYAARTQ